MKMQNEIQAPVSGTVVSVQCSEGEAIEANASPLVVIEPTVKRRRRLRLVTIEKGLM